LERKKSKYNRNTPQARTYTTPKIENKPPQQSSTLWKDSQLRDYRKANGLCFNYGEKFVPEHLDVCTKRNKPYANALFLNDLVRELTDDTLNTTTD